MNPQIRLAQTVLWVRNRHALLLEILSTVLRDSLADTVYVEILPDSSLHLPEKDLRGKTG